MRNIDLMGGTEVITESECWELLREHDVGRVGVVVDSEVDIFPVNYLVEEERIVFATNDGRKFLGLQTGETTFEIDGFEEQARAGWSVIVHGFLESVTPYAKEEGEPQPWTGPKDHVIRVKPVSITGRRVLDAFWPSKPKRSS